VLVLKQITPEQSQVLGDIAANLIKKVLKLSREAKGKLSKHRDFVYCIGDIETGHTKRLRCIKKDPEAALELIASTVDKVRRLVNQN